MQIRRVRKDKMFTLFLSILLAFSIIVTSTFAVFSATSNVTGTITFDANVAVIVSKGYGATSSTDTSVTYNVTPNYVDLHTGTIYADGATNAIKGTYGNLYYQTGAGTTAISPDITYTISGKGEAFIALQLEIKFTPTTYSDFGESGTVNLNNVDEWNIYPIFASGFLPNEIVDSNGDSEFSFINLNVGTVGGETYGIITSAPFTRTNGTSTYSKIYTMYVVASENEIDTMKLSLDSPITLQLENIINEFRFATEYTDTAGIATSAPILSGGTIELCVTCKASIFEVFFD